MNVEVRHPLEKVMFMAPTTFAAWQVKSASERIDMRDRLGCEYGCLMILDPSVPRDDIYALPLVEFLQRRYPKFTVHVEVTA